MEGPARVPVEPGYDLGVLVAGMAVKDHVHQLAGRHRHLDGAQEGDERLVAVPAIDGTAVDPVPKATGPALSGPVGQRPTTVPSSTLSAANRVVVPSGSARSPAGIRHRCRCTAFQGHMPALSDRALWSGYSGGSVAPE